jgi:hypothetical protein
LISQAKAVRERLKKLGATVSPSVLNVVRSTVCNEMDVAKALLRDIDRDCESNEADITLPSSNTLFEHQDGAPITEQLHLAAACWWVADVDILVEMLTIPSLRTEAQQVFERAIAKGAFGEHSVVMVLERRHTQRLIMESRCHLNGLQSEEASLAGSKDTSASEDDDDFPVVLGLAEALALSPNVRVREFVSTLYAVMFKVYCGEAYRERMLRGLVENATGNADAPIGTELSMDILSFLVGEEEGTARPVLCMMREAVELANADRAILYQKLRASEEEIALARKERQGEVNNLMKEKLILSQKATEAENAQARLKVSSGFLYLQFIILKGLYGSHVLSLYCEERA